MAWDESKHPRDNDGKFARYNSMSIDELKREAMSPLPKTIKLPDEIIPRSVGAKWVNYEISIPDGTTAHFVEGSKLQNKEVFAGKGCKRKIDCIESLVATYGGTASEWTKVKAHAEIQLPNGEIINAEIHWYEEPSVGKVQIKYKRAL